ncbi:MAG: exsB protein, partial [Cyanobacteriota bacterium]
MKAVILLSGGLDSSTVLYQAKEDGCECYAISFDYQQRHRKELSSALMVGKRAGIIQHQVVNFDLRQWGGS